MMRISPSRLENTTEILSHRKSERAGFALCLLMLFLLYPQMVPAGGIGFQNFTGTVTITNSTLRNNFIAIQSTVTNGSGNHSLLIENNVILDSSKFGIIADHADTAGSIVIRNNSLDNSNIPSTAPFTRNGNFGIGIRNHESLFIDGNSISNFGRSGIRLQSIANITATNNFLTDNGSQGYTDTVDGEKRYYGSGIQAISSTFSSITDNIIFSNKFSGIADNLSVGTIGPNNIIRHNGDRNLGINIDTGSITDCVTAAAGGGLMRGGILAWSLPSEDSSLSVCNNQIYSNFNTNIAHTGPGAVYSCENRVLPFFASADDTVYYYDSSSGHVVHDCGGSIINANSKAFGIVIIGETSDVTVQNCTIQNAALNNQATTGNGRILGSGIFIANNSTPLIRNNYISDNGWVLLDDRIYTEAGASGIQMRCGGEYTSIVNNIIASNANDGLIGRESGGLIGLVNMGNTFRNNGRNGIGIYDGTTRNLEIAYNAIYGNQRGVGVLNFDGKLLSISHNRIYSNISTLSSAAGIAVRNLDPSGSIMIANNTIANNSGWKVGGIGLKNDSMTTVDFNVTSNTIYGNAQSGIGIGYAKGFTISNNRILYNGAAGFHIGDEYYSSGIQIRNSSFTNESVVDNFIHSNQFAGIGVYKSGGTIGRASGDANDIKFNGNPDDVSSSVCTGIGGTGRGGISVRDLVEDLFVEDYTYIVTNNYNKEVQLAPGSPAALYYNGEEVNTTYWGKSDVALYVTGDTTINCNNGSISGGNIWGVVIVGGYKVTIENCDIKNNCTDAIACNVGTGGGVLVAGGAQVYMHNNSVYNNGFAAYPVGEGGYAGVVLRCADIGTTLINNIVDNNKNNGISLFATNGYIGLEGAGNTISNNGRHGIGITSFEGGTNTGPVVAYNKIYSNTTFGIGSWSLTNMNVAILNNTIYSNHIANSLGIGGADIGGGIGMLNLLSEVSISNNIIRNNTSVEAGAGIGINATNGATVSIVNNIIEKNTSSNMAGGIGFNDLTNTRAYISGSIFNNSGGTAGGIGFSATNGSDTQITIEGSDIYGNISDEVGGIGFNNLSLGTRIELKSGLNVYNNKGGKVGGIGVTLSNGVYAFVNINVYNNLGSNTDPFVDNVGGIGFNGIDNVASTISIANSHIYNNRSSGIMGHPRGRVGGLGVSLSNASISLVNSDIFSNSGICIGGSGFDLVGGHVVVSANNYYKNRGSSNSYGAGGLAFDYTSGKITVLNNNLYDNENTVTGVGAMGFNMMQAGGSAYVAGNNIYANTGPRAAGIGITAANASSVIEILSNSIYNNNQSGIGIRDSNYLSVYNNTILSNGLNDEAVTDLHNGFGIQLRNAAFSFNNIHDNTIRHNKYAGMGFYTVTGTIGPNNNVTNNGLEGAGISCPSIGDGRGGVSARALPSAGLHVMDSLDASYDAASNMVRDNYFRDAQYRPGSGSGYFIYNKQTISNQWYGPSDAVYYYEGIASSTSANLDCNNGTIDAEADGLAGACLDINGNPRPCSFGVIVMGPNTDVTVQNCTIKNAATNYKFLEDVKSPDGDEHVAGAGILVAANAKVYVTNNYITENGMDMSRSLITDSDGTTLLPFYWIGGGATNEFGENQFWMKTPTLTADEDRILYLYSGDSNATLKSNLKNTFIKLNAEANEDGLISYWNFDTNYIDSVGNNDGINHGTFFYNNDFRFFAGLAWQNMTSASYKSLRMEENAGEGGYVEVSDGDFDLNLEKQTILCWFSTGPGPLYTRKPSVSYGGVELSVIDNYRIKYKIENVMGQVYSAVSPEDSFDDERANCHYVAAMYEGAGKKLKLYLSNNLVASTSVPSGFFINYADATSYIGGININRTADNETFSGLIDEMAIYDKALSQMHLESQHYMRNLGGYEEAGQTSWPTVEMGPAESGSWSVDGITWKNRWPITISNVLVNLYNFQVGPALVKSPDSGGILMRCVGSDTTIVNNNLYNNRRDGISGMDLAAVRIGSNNVHDNERFGIGLRGTLDNLRIYSNEVYDNDRGIGGYDTHKGTYPFTIANNHIYRNKYETAGFKKYGIMFSLANSSMIIEGNLIEDGSRGIGFQNGASGTDILIRNNSITNNTVNAITMESMDAPNNVSIVNNYLYNGNTIVRMRNNSLSNITIANNRFVYGIRNGILCDNCGNLFVDNNDFIDNSWAGNKNSVQSAVKFRFLDETSSMKINNNRFTGNRKNVILFHFCEGTEISLTNNDIQNNACRYNGSCGSVISNLGVFRFEDNDSLTNLVIDGNIIENNYTDAIKFANNHNTPITISNNSIKHNLNGMGIKFQDGKGTRPIFIQNNSINSNESGIWFKHTSAPIRLEGNTIAYNLGIGYRCQEVPDTIIGRPDYVPSIEWTNRGEDDLTPSGIYSRMNGASENGLFFGCNSDPYKNERKQAFLDDILANGGNVIRDNGSWGVQTQGDETFTNVEFHGMYFTGNAAPFGAMGNLSDISVHDSLFGGNGGHAAGVKGQGTLVLDNVVALCGNGVIQNQDSAAVRVENYSYIFQKIRGGGVIEVYNRNFINCMNRCIGGMGGSGGHGAQWHIWHYNHIAAHFPAGSGSFDIHDHNTFSAGNPIESNNGAPWHIYDNNYFTGGGNMRRNQGGAGGFRFDNNHFTSNHNVTARSSWFQGNTFRNMSWYSGGIIIGNHFQEGGIISGYMGNGYSAYFNTGIYQH